MAAGEGSKQPANTPPINAVRSTARASVWRTTVHLPRESRRRHARDAQAPDKHRYTHPFIVHAACSNIRIETRMPGGTAGAEPRRRSFRTKCAVRQSAQVRLSCAAVSGVCWYAEPNPAAASGRCTKNGPLTAVNLLLPTAGTRYRVKGWRLPSPDRRAAGSGNAYARHAPPTRSAIADSIRNIGSNASADVLPKPSTSPLPADAASIEKPDSGNGPMPWARAASTIARSR